MREYSRLVITLSPNWQICAGPRGRRARVFAFGDNHITELAQLRGPRGRRARVFAFGDNPITERCSQTREHAGPAAESAVGARRSVLVGEVREGEVREYSRSVITLSPKAIGRVHLMFIEWLRSGNVAFTRL